MSTDSFERTADCQPESVSACHPAQGATECTDAGGMSSECCGGGDESHHCAMTSTDGILRPGPLDGCPTPLGWRQVLNTFQEQSTPWELSRPGYTLQGRTWGTGPALYLLCGMGGTTDSYSLLVYLLKDLFRCVVFDYPGTRSRLPRSVRPTLETLSYDLLAVADLQGDDQFDLFGHSFGSLITLQTLLQAPSRVRKAVIQGGFAHRNLSFAERFIVMLGAWLPGRLRSLPLAKTIQQQNHRIWFPAQDPSRWQFFVDDAGQLSNSTLSHRAALIRDVDFRPRLGEIQQSVRLIQCEGDGLVSRHCHEELSHGLQHSQTEWMHSAGHIPHLTNPHRLAKSMRDFLLEKSPS